MRFHDRLIGVAHIPMIGRVKAVCEEAPILLIDSLVWSAIGEHVETIDTWPDMQVPVRMRQKVNEP